LKREVTAVNVISKKFQSDPNLFMAIALVAIAVDIVRVLPLTLTDMYLAPAGGGFHLFLGVADLAMILFMTAATPTLPAILAMIGGAVTGTVVQLVGVPAVSGWVSICVPWLLVNRGQFRLTRKEIFGVWAVGLVCCWGILVLLGHVVDPGMQGEDSVGWLYDTEEVEQDEIHPGLLVQFRKGPFLFMRRVQSVEGDEVILDADNPSFGEGYRALKIACSEVTGRVSWLFLPRALFGRSGSEWQKKAILIGMAAEKLPVPNASALYYNPRAEAWVVVDPSWRVIQSGEGKPLVLGLTLASIGSSALVVYDSREGFVEVAEHRFEEAGELHSSSIVIRYREDVIMIDGGGARNIGGLLPGESLPEATRRLVGLELSP